MISTFLYITFLFFSLGQLGRISLFSQQINFYLYELMMAFTLLVFLTKSGVKPLKISIKKIPAVYLFFAYLLLSFTVSGFRFNPAQNLVGLLYYMRLVFYWLFFVYVKGHIKKKHLMVFIVITIVVSIIQFLFYPDLRNLIYLGWDPHFHRLFGTFLDTSVAGAVYGLIFMYLLTQLPNPLLIVTYLIFVVLTYSRSLYISFIITNSLYFIRRKLNKKLLMLIGIFLILLIAIPTRFGTGVGLTRIFSIESRLSDYQEAFKIWRQNPILGIGYNHIAYVKGSIGPYPNHANAGFSSSYLIMLVDAGIIGLAMFVYLLFTLSPVNKKVFYYVIFLGLLSLTDNILLHPFVMFLFGSVILISLSDT